MNRASWKAREEREEDVTVNSSLSWQKSLTTLRNEPGKALSYTRDKVHCEMQLSPFVKRATNLSWREHASLPTRLFTLWRGMFKEKIIWCMWMVQTRREVGRHIFMAWILNLNKLRVWRGCDTRVTWVSSRHELCIFPRGGVPTPSDAQWTGAPRCPSNLDPRSVPVLWVSGWDTRASSMKRSQPLLKSEEITENKKK